MIKRAESENGRGQQDIGIPAELQRREARLEKITENKTEREMRATERYAQEQANFTDSDSGIMPMAGSRFEQAYNTQATVDLDTMLIIGQHVSQNTNDKQEVAPALEQLSNLPSDLG